MSASPSNLRQVVITGVGLISARGIGRAAHEGPLVAAEPAPLSDYLGDEHPTQRAFQVAKVRPQPFMLRRKDLKLMSRDARLAVQAAGLALTDAGLTPMDAEGWPSSPQEVGLFMGVGLEPGDIVELAPVMPTCVSEGQIDAGLLGRDGIDMIPPLSSLKTLPNMALAHVSINFGLMGPGEALSPWGPSGVQALGVAAEAIARGECDVALVGAADSDVDLGGVGTHTRLGALADQRPHADERAAQGLILGEGGAFFVLETRQSAQERGATILGSVAEVRSVGARAETLPDFAPDGIAEVARGLVGEDHTKVVSAAGHHEGWQAAEAEALAALGVSGAEIVRPGLALGWCVAASGLIDLAVALVSDDVDDAAAVLGLSWGPSGEWAAARVVMEAKP